MGYDGFVPALKEIHRQYYANTGLSLLSVTGVAALPSLYLSSSSLWQI